MALALRLFQLFLCLPYLFISTENTAILYQSILSSFLLPLLKAGSDNGN